MIPSKSSSESQRQRSSLRSNGMFVSNHLKSMIPSSSSSFVTVLFLTTIMTLLVNHVAASESNPNSCLSNPELEFAITQTLDGPDTTSSSSSCCANHICGLPCPVEVTPPTPVYGIVMIVSVVISFVVGMISYVCVRGQSENYFLAGRSLNLTIVAVTLAAASIDSNALLGNADLSYKYQFWDGGKYSTFQS
jgi:hypothetical protein